MPGHFLNAHPGDPVDLILFTAVVAAVALLPLPGPKGLQLTLSFPVLLGVSILYDPVVAGAVAMIGVFDSRELRLEIALSKALFNRAQIALATVSGSWVFHGVTSPESPLLSVAIGAVLATAANYAVNVALVALAIRLLYGVQFRAIVGELRFGALNEFILNYLGLAFVGVIIASLYAKVGLWSVAAFILPVVFARQMFFRNLALEEATKELKDREKVLRALSNRMAEERQDERMQIAAYLHDDLAQMLFRLNLQVEMAKKRLSQGELDAVQRDLDGITATKQQTSDAVRSLIRDLHRSPIGREGLSEAIQSFVEDIRHGQPAEITTDLVEVSLPPPIQLLIYQIAREAAMNALKHAQAEHISILLHEKDEGVELEIRDDGKGFDTSLPPPEGHLGTVMMRERALVAGGTYSIHSENGNGTVVTATFPRVWVEEGSLHEATRDPNGGTAQRREASPPKGTAVGPSRPVVGVRRSPDPTSPESDATSPPQGRDEEHEFEPDAVHREHRHVPA